MNLYIHQGIRGYTNFITECRKIQQVIHKSMKVVASQRVTASQNSTMNGEGRTEH